MKKNYLLSSFTVLCLLFSFRSEAQIIDTLAIQDFELTPATPTWNFTGPVVYNSGFSGAAVSPPNSPIGIAGSRAWETTSNSGGLILDFNNVAIVAGYDSIRVHFNLAAMNLVASGGGPDNLDYVLVAYSTDGGLTYTNRLRIRGSVADNSFWEYAATGVAKVYYTPAVETLFQPLTTSGLQVAEGYSNCEIVFPGSVTQVQLRITGRSSSSTDTWLVDNVLITGELSTSVGISEISTSQVNIYPNPTTGDAAIQFEKAKDRTIEIMNVTGQIVRTLKVNSALINLELPAENGIYFIRVRSNDEVSTHRIIKQ